MMQKSGELLSISALSINLRRYSKALGDLLSDPCKIMRGDNVLKMSCGSVTTSYELFGLGGGYQAGTSTRPLLSST